MKIQLLLVLLLLFNFNGNSQNLSINLDIGYGFKLAQNNFEEKNTIAISPDVNQLEVIKYSFGEGINYNSSIEYSPNAGIGFGLGLGFLSSKDHNRVSEDGSFESEEKIKASMLRLYPFIRLKYNLSRLSIYSRFGYVISLSNKIESELRSKDDNNNTIQDVRIFSGGNSKGLIAGLGFEYPITDRLNISTEIRVFVQSYGPKKSELIESYWNGEDMLDQLPPVLIFTNYEDRYIQENRIPDLDKPLTRSRIYHPFSSMGINIGLSFDLINNDDSFTE